MLAAETAELKEAIGRLVAAVAPWLLELPGMGPISAAQVLVSWSHAGRLRSEAAFAALHIVALVRLRDDPQTRAYAARRGAEGKSPREIRRCIKRAVARNLFKLLQRLDRPEVEVVRAG
jgi:transposase